MLCYNRTNKCFGRTRPLSEGQVIVSFALTYPLAFLS
jgi:hypothetical protein